MSGRVEILVEDRIALVRLNRPEKHNALDRESFEALAAAGESLANEAGIRAVIIAGAGGSFCAGIDRSVFESGHAAVSDASMKPRADRIGNFYQSAAMVWRELPVPVIAAVHGAAYGAGLQIAMAADIRIAAPAARLSIMEINWGIIPDMGITATFRHVVPMDRIRLLAFTGNVIGGAEALRMGLVTELADEPLVAAKNLAGLIASRSPEALRAIKLLCNRSFDEEVPRALRREAELQQSLFGTRNQREAVLARLEQREPDFEDPQT